jgi:hypothetical protein
VRLQGEGSGCDGEDVGAGWAEEQHPDCLLSWKREGDCGVE